MGRAEMILIKGRYGGVQGSEARLIDKMEEARDEREVGCMVECQSGIGMPCHGRNDQGRGQVGFAASIREV